MTKMKENMHVLHCKWKCRLISRVGRSPNVLKMAILPNHLILLLRIALKEIIGTC